MDISALKADLGAKRPRGFFHEYFRVEVKKRWNSGRKRRFSGWFGEVLRGLDLVWDPPTFGRNLPKNLLTYLWINAKCCIGTIVSVWCVDTNDNVDVDDDDSNCNVLSHVQWLARCRAKRGARHRPWTVTLVIIIITITKIILDRPINVLLLWFSGEVCSMQPSLLGIGSGKSGESPFSHWFALVRVIHAKAKNRHLCNPGSSILQELKNLGETCYLFTNLISISLFSPLAIFNPSFSYFPPRFPLACFMNVDNKWLDPF